jgi:hypothetical protein
MMGGSGTVPFEAALQGRIGIGSDISPLAHVITSAKVSPPLQSEVDSVLCSLSKFIETNAGLTNIDEMEEEIRGFYEPRTAQEIITARNWLYNHTNGFQSNSAVLFVTACLAHILHGNRPYALSRRSHNIIPIPPKGDFVYKPVMKSLVDKCVRTMKAPLPRTFINGHSYLASASALPMEMDSIDIVITSPPFLGTTHFLRQNRVRLWLTGWDYDTQRQERLNFIEHSKEPSAFLPILKDAHRVLRINGLAIFHIGIVKSVNMADELAPYFQSAGFEELGRIWEDTANLESHGRTDRGSTHTHGFLFLRKV